MSPSPPAFIVESEINIPRYEQGLFLLKVVKDSLTVLTTIVLSNQFIFPPSHRSLHYGTWRTTRRRKPRERRQIQEVHSWWYELCLTRINERSS